MAGPAVTNLTGPYRPGPKEGMAFFFKATTAVATVQRLGDLITVPTVTDEQFAYSMGSPAGLSGTTAGLPITRPPFHVIFQVPIAAANPIYMTWDNNTAPVVGGPGYELNAGQSILFENAGLTLLRPKSAGTYLVDAKTAFKFIAAAATVLLIDFSD